MKRFAKWMAWILGTLLVLLVVAALVLPLVIDPNAYKDDIEAAARDATGRTVTLEGDIELSILPRIGLSMGPVTLGNADGFGPRPMLRAGTIAASVELWPLLQKKVRIDSIELAEVELLLEVNESGKDNWSDLAADPAPEPAESTAAVDLSVQSVRFANGTIEFDDRSTGSKLILSAVTLNTGAIVTGQPTELSLRSDYALGEELGGALELDGTVTGLLGESPIRATLRDLELTQSAEPQIRFSTPEATVDLAGNGSLSIPEYAVQSHNMRLRGNVVSQNLTASMRVSGTLTIEEFAVDEWLAATGLYAVPTTDASALDSLSGEVEWAVADIVTINRLNVTLDDTVLRGSVKAGDSIQFELNADQIDVDRYLPPPGEATTAEPSEAPAEPLQFPRLAGALTVGTFSMSGMQASNVLLRIEGDEDGLRVLPIRGKMYGGTFEGQLDLVDARSKPSATTSLKLTRINGGELIKAVSGSEVVSGIGRMQADFRIDEPFSANPLASLNGDLSFNFRDGKIYGFDITNIYQQVLQLADAASDERLATDFSNLGFSAKIVDGILRTNGFDLDSQTLRVGGSGEINLAQGTIDLDLRPVLVKAPEGTSALAKLEGVEIPLRISGPMTAPSVKFDPAAALVASQKGRVEGKVREKLGLEQDESGEDRGLEGLLMDALNKELEERAGDDEEKNTADDDSQGA